MVRVVIFFVENVSLRFNVPNALQPAALLYWPTEWTLERIVGLKKCRVENGRLEEQLGTVLKQRMLPYSGR